MDKNLENVTQDPEVQIRKMSRRSFFYAGAAVIGAVGFRQWLANRPDASGIPSAFRSAFEFNEKIGRTLFRSTALAPTFPKHLAGEPRPNGDIGLDTPLKVEEWNLIVEGVYMETLTGLFFSDGKGQAEEFHRQKEPLSLSLAYLKQLPRTEMITELKCIEGWSQVVQWAGVTLSDFMVKHPPTPKGNLPPDVLQRPNDLPEYVGLATPDGEYYVGLDRASALHPQTLLAYEMNGQPLTEEHGAPLRLVIPVKYGIKNIKRIGVIRYTDERPADYWAEQGYDWYAGL